jgi:hypothetical protein
MRHVLAGARQVRLALPVSASAEYARSRIFYGPMIFPFCRSPSTVQRARDIPPRRPREGAHVAASIND